LYVFYFDCICFSLIVVVSVWLYLF